jgi:hypothetical protein
MPVVGPQAEFGRRLNRRQKPSFSHLFSDNPRHLCWRRRKNSRKTSKKSTKSGAKWRFFEIQSAISTCVYTTGAEPQITGMPGLTSAFRDATSNLLTANSEMERHFFGCDSDRPVLNRRDMTVAPGC